MVKEYNERNRTRFTWLFAAFIVVVMFISHSAWEKWPIVEESLFLVACLLAGCGALGRAWCTVFIAGRKDGVLVRQGPYAICRNPLYFFSFLGALGVGLATETVTVPLLIVAAFVLYYPAVIHAEEKRLAELFGAQYEQYRRDVPCFFPKLSLLAGNEPDEYPVCTRAMRRGLFDTLWFIWAVGAVELLSAFHETGLIPPLLGLY